MGHGELVEVSVTGGQELAAVAAEVLARAALACSGWTSLAVVARQIAIADVDAPFDTPPPICVAA